MAVQDLTPQLRTRLSRLEKAVGWFVTVAAVLLLAGLGYYIYKVADRKGWFVTKAPYFTYLSSGAGIKVGDPVKLMGFDAGEITKIEPEAPGMEYDVYVEFEVQGRNIGYVWTDSQVNVKSAGLLGARYLEITKGGTIRATNLHATYKQEAGRLVGIYLDRERTYTNWHRGDKGYWLLVDEPAELASEIAGMVETAKEALPNILALTNALTTTLMNAAESTEHLKGLLAGAKGVVSNLTLITENLKEPRGSLGEWLFPTNMNQQLTILLTNANATVANVNVTVTNANTNLVVLFSNITVSLENLAGMTSNLNAQVQGNSNIVRSVSDLIVHSDEMVQGLKKHWLLRSAFKTNDALPRPLTREPKGQGRK